MPVQSPRPRRLSSAAAAAKSTLDLVVVVTIVLHTGAYARLVRFESRRYHADNTSRRGKVRFGRVVATLSSSNELRIAPVQSLGLGNLLVDP